MIEGLLDSLKGLKPADLRKSDTKINSSLETDLNRLMARIDDLDEQPPTELIDQQAYLTEAAKAFKEETNKIVPLEQVQNHLDQGWLKGRWR